MNVDADAVKRAEQKKALENIKNGLATKVRIVIAKDACPACEAAAGAYDFDNVPKLPVEGCSHPGGCRCRYEPVLDHFGP
jgi:hypothetical protein